MNKQEIEKYIFLDDLPRTGNGIDWKRCVGRNIPFSFGDIDGNITVKNHIPGYHENGRFINSRIEIEYEGRSKIIATNDMYRCPVAKLVGALKCDHIYRVGQRIVDNARDITITSLRYEVISGRKYKTRTYGYLCNICGWGDGVASEYIIKRGHKCSCCSNKVVVAGINDIATTDPWMVKYVGCDFAQSHVAWSTEKLFPICPDCGRTMHRKMSSAEIKHTGGIYCDCSKTVSYPERVIRALLEYVGVDYIPQYSFKQVSDKKFDFYINHNGTEIIIETHGGQHYYGGFERCGGDTLEETIANDDYKYNVALSSGIAPSNYVVIDCSKSDIEFIKKSVMSSNLLDIFDFSYVDWEEIARRSSTNRVLELCEYRRSNPEASTKDIAKTFHIDKSTVLSWLRRGTTYGWA